MVQLSKLVSDSVAGARNVSLTTIEEIGKAASNVSKAVCWEKQKNEGMATNVTGRKKIRKRRGQQLVERLTWCDIKDRAGTVISPPRKVVLLEGYRIVLW